MSENTDTSDQQPIITNGNGGSGSKPARAAKACRRCHRKKLRCHGGCPCVNCKRAHQSCDFGELSLARALDKDGVVQDVDDRFNQLERMVQSLLNRMGDTSTNSLPISILSTQQQQQQQEQQPAIPISNVVPPEEIASNIINQPIHPDFPSSLFFSPSTSQIGFDNGQTIGLTQASPPDPIALPHNQHSPAGRLALATSDGVRGHAPLRALAFNPAHWENADRTRPPSPVPEPIEQAEDFWTNIELRPGLEHDPVSLGIIQETTARALIDIFLRYCHPFLPVLEFSRPETERYHEIREMGPYLFTTILAVASRFKPGSNASSAGILPSLDPEASLKIRRLAYSHVASSMFRRHQSLRDLQATLFVAGWGMHSSYDGPESWMNTGHCGRLAYKLNLHKLGKVDITRTLEGKTPTERTKLVGQWKTWLCWWCFDTSIELGFGRPVTMYTEPDENGFLALIDRLPVGSDTASGLYLISLTRLIKIGREMSRWLQMLNDQDESNRSLSDIGPMLQHLNSQIDQWYQTWIWKGSSYYLRLGKYSRLVKLQSEHLRLSLNSLALKSTFAEVLRDSRTDPSEYVTAASMAALDIIQAYVESAGSDQYLSFSLDYISLTIGHALIFLVRLYLYTQPIPIERSVILHYLESAIDLMSSSIISANGQVSHIARTCRDLCRTSGIPLPCFQTDSTDCNLVTNEPFMTSDLSMDTTLFNDLTGDQADFGWLLGLPTFGLTAEDGDGLGGAGFRM